MSNRRLLAIDDPQWSLYWYMRGYYPLYDILGRFYWERLPERAFVPIDAETVKRAAAMARRSESKFRIVKDQHFDACIRHLQDPRVKDFSWVREEVVRIYQALRSVGLLVTVEAINAGGKLAGGLVAIILPGVLIAETMFALEPDASKVCLCKLVEELHRRGYSMMDVQTRHDRDASGEEIRTDGNRTAHPCVRLGEKVQHVEQFMPLFTRIIADGGFKDFHSWLEAAIEVWTAQQTFLNGYAGAARQMAQRASENAEIRRALGWMAIHLDERYMHAVEAETFR